MKRILFWHKWKILLIVPSFAVFADDCDNGYILVQFHSEVISDYYSALADSEVIAIGDCPSGFVEFGTIEDSCPSGTVEYGRITDLILPGLTDGKGTYSCSL
ncbi:MAG: hypothetical protein LBB08_02825 [Rickettsiales bacterium]|jgi:hypothetical protein|nr:hypothetical protein [Rickettsiales bacterium]